MAEGYPKRPPLFALKFIRLLGKIGYANMCGSDAAWLLTVIAGTEDAKRYRSPVTFFNGQLLSVSGHKSIDSLARTRERAVLSGWLHYEPGGKGKAGRYWVQIPNEFDTSDDTPIDENEDDYLCLSSAHTRKETGYKPDTNQIEASEKPETSAEHSILFLPNPKREEAPPAAAPVPKIEKFDPRKIPIPKELDSQSFREIWELWIVSRMAKGAKGKFTELAILAQFRKLIPLGIESAIEAVNDAIAGGWQSFHPKAKGFQKPKADTATEAERIFARMQEIAARNSSSLGDEP